MEDSLTSMNSNPLRSRLEWMSISAHITQLTECLLHSRRQIAVWKQVHNGQRDIHQNATQYQSKGKRSGLSMDL